MKLPGGDSAYIDPRKLVAYALDVDHREGGADKARVFDAVLGLGVADASVLSAALLAAARTREAVATGQSTYGALFRIDFVFSFNGRSARLRSGWIVPSQDGPTRLTTVFVLPSSK